MKELSKIHHQYSNSSLVNAELRYIYVYIREAKEVAQQILEDGKLKRILRDEADDEVVIVQFRMADLFRGPSTWPRDVLSIANRGSLVGGKLARAEW